MMVHTSTHLGISVCLRGWAILPGHRSNITLHHLPPHHLPPNDGQHAPPSRRPQRSTVTLLFDGNDTPRDPFSPPGAPGAHLLTPQGQVEDERATPREHNETETQDSCLCLCDGLPQSWLSCRIFVTLPLCLVVITS